MMAMRVMHTSPAALEDWRAVAGVNSKPASGAPFQASGATRIPCTSNTRIVDTHARFVPPSALQVSTRAAMSTRAAQVALPTGNAVNVRVFEISVSGTTYWGDANFLENNPNFRWARWACS